MSMGEKKHMREAFERWSTEHQGRKLSRQPDGPHAGRYLDYLVRAAWEGCQFALAHPTPAAPAVTESTHTGAVPDFSDPDVQAAYQILCDDTPTPEGRHREGFDAERIVAALRAAQPSPERNDCEPVVIPRGWKLVPIEPTNEMLHAGMDASCTQEKWDAMIAASPPPAERQYCERCGKRLGHTEGVHTCTPPEGGA